MREIVRPSCCIFMDIRVFDIYFLSMDYEQNFNLKLVSVGYRVVYVWIDFNPWHIYTTRIWNFSRFSYSLNHNYGGT